MRPRDIAWTVLRHLLIKIGHGAFFVLVWLVIYFCALRLL